MTQYPAFLAGQRLTATLLGATVPDVTVKSAAQVRTSTTTYADDSELSGIALGVGTWEIINKIFMTGGSAGIAIKTQWSFTGTWNNPLRMLIGPTAANTTAPASGPPLNLAPILWNSDQIYGLSTSGAYQRVIEETRNAVVTGAGNYAFRWAPNVSNANSGGIQAASSVTVRRIA